MRKSFAELDKENNGDYLKLLSAISKLSGLFSESATPLINYRVAENIFCKSFNANNLSRSDSAFDAEYNSIGIGLKTFICKGESSTEKVAEFNSLSKVLEKYKGKDLAIKLSEYRNERIDLANRLYEIESSLYHIVGRRDNELLLFETDYDKVNINKISSVKEAKSSLQFSDGNNQYSYNYSKSTLFRKFLVPKNAFQLPVDIIEDPYKLILDIFEDKSYDLAKNKLIAGDNYVILPLFSTSLKPKQIPLKSGLNQWNAGGRKRDVNEVYIPIPSYIHNKYPTFFPNRDKPFNLTVPTKETFSAKICQENGKALMTNPNKALSDWLLRKVLKLHEEEFATIEKLDELGFDSVIINKISESDFKIDIMKTGSYERFVLG